jgi:hypothetical protein
MSAIKIRQLTKDEQWLGYQMHQFRELTRVKMRIVVQTQKGDRLLHHLRQ